MRFAFSTNEFEVEAPVRIGNIYNVRGGRRASRGEYWVLVGISDCGQTGYLLAVNREGRVCGTSLYGMHVLRDWTPVAFAQGLEDMTFDVVSI